MLVGLAEDMVTSGIFNSLCVFSLLSRVIPSEFIYLYYNWWACLCHLEAVKRLPVFHYVKCTGCLKTVDLFVRCDLENLAARNETLPHNVS